MARRRRSISLQRARPYSVANEVAANIIITRRLLASLSPLTMLEDRRVFHPERDYRPARTFSRIDQRRLVPASLVTDRIMRSGQLRFAVPDKVVVCVRRKQRREVLHALRRTGKGAGAPRHRNYQSDISCKR